MQRFLIKKAKPCATIYRNSSFYQRHFEAIAFLGHLELTSFCEQIYIDRKVSSSISAIKTMNSFPSRVAHVELMICTYAQTSLSHYRCHFLLVTVDVSYSWNLKLQTALLI